MVHSVRSMDVDISNSLRQACYFPLQMQTVHGVWRRPAAPAPGGTPPDGGDAMPSFRRKQGVTFIQRHPLPRRRSRASKAHALLVLIPMSLSSVFPSPL